jgi:hypothetical protein
MASSERTDSDAHSDASAHSDSHSNARAPLAGTGGSKERPEESGLASGPAPARETLIEKETRASCLMNAHYHAAREAFLDNVHRWFMFLVIALGAVALTDVLPRLLALAGFEVGPAHFKEICAACAAIIAALDLTFDLSNRARTHTLMKRRYFELAADVRERKKSPVEAKACIDRFSADEEPNFRVVLLACYNIAQESVFGDDFDKYVISGWASFWMNNIRRPTVTFPVVLKPVKSPQV